LIKLLPQMPLLLLKMPYQKPPPDSTLLMLPLKPLKLPFKKLKPISVLPDKTY
jgi:hypothetical protein